MPSPWNDGTDRKLLLTIIHLTAPKLPEWNQVATLMGEGFTAESTRQHFQKMRKDCKAEFGESGIVTPNPEMKGTPRKPKPAKTNGATPSKSTGKRKNQVDAEVEHDDEEGQSPSKKVKAECKGADQDFDFA
ncbi:hypothetical protein LTR85_004507 [Meristemomyces frigidus]|nr:hypothetical protein LTR85_004507 [Meristemomyces frigidus]